MDGSSRHLAKGKLCNKFLKIRFYRIRVKRRKMNIYLLTLLKDKWDCEEELLAQYVSEERRKRCQKYKFDKDRLLCLYAELLLRYVLIKEFSVSGETAEIGISNYGKPYLISEKEIYFNYSHTYNTILLAISDKNAVGVDIEYIEDRAPLDIMDVLYNDSEIDYIMNAKDMLDRKHRFYEIWTKKEAYTKKEGVGLVHQDIKSINVLDQTIKEQTISWIENTCMCSVNFGTDYKYKIVRLSNKDIEFI